MPTEAQILANHIELRNTQYETCYTRIGYPESSNDLCKTNPICWTLK